jgi:hypothetical protein
VNSRRFPPTVTWVLGRPPGLDRLVWAIWLATGLILGAALLFLSEAGEMRVDQQPMLLMACGLSWLALATVLVVVLKKDPLRGSVLRHQAGAWFVQHTGTQTELPCEIALMADVQHSVLVRMKVASTWHWHWLNSKSLTPSLTLSQAPTSTTQGVPNQFALASPWLSLRQALVWSSKHP